MKTLTVIKNCSFVLSVLLLLGIAGCKKSSEELTAATTTDFGCTSTTVLQNMNNTPAQLVYSSAGPFAGDWLIVTDFGSTRSYSCVFCDRSVYSTIVAGRSQSTPINVTVSGSIRRRYQNQEPINATSGGYETYVINVTSIQ